MARGHTSLARVKVDTWYDGYESHDRMVLPCPICRARNPKFHRTKRFNSLFILIYPLHKIFSHLQNKKVRNNVFLYIKIDFWHGRSGQSWLSYPITFLCMSTYWKIMTQYKKNKDGCCQLGFQSRWFSTKTTRVFQRRSLLVYLCRFCRQRKVKTFSSCGAHFRSGDYIFSVQIATTTVCITRKMHLYRHLSRFLGRSLDFSSVWEGSWIWACGWGNIVWGGGGG